MVSAGSFFQLSGFTLPAAGFSHGSAALEGLALGLEAAESFLSLPSKAPAANAPAPATTTTANADAITVLRVRALRRADSRRCCCRKNFSRASCRRR